MRSDWTKLAKEFQKELYLKIFKEEEIKSWIKETVKKLQEGEFDNLLVYKKRLRRKVEDYTKSIPPHVKAAKMLENPGKTVKYVMTLRGPVPIQLEPKDLDYEHYIDKQLKPIADSVLEFVDLEFDKLVKAGYFSQKKLFMA